MTDGGAEERVELEEVLPEQVDDADGRQPDPLDVLERVDEVERVAIREERLEADEPLVLLVEEVVEEIEPLLVLEEQEVAGHRRLARQLIGDQRGRVVELSVSGRVPWALTLPLDDRRERVVDEHVADPIRVQQIVPDPLVVLLERREVTPERVREERVGAPGSPRRERGRLDVSHPGNPAFRVGLDLHLGHEPRQQELADACDVVGEPSIEAVLHLLRPPPEHRLVDAEDLARVREHALVAREVGDALHLNLPPRTMARSSARPLEPT